MTLRVLINKIARICAVTIFCVLLHMAGLLWLNHVEKLIFISRISIYYIFHFYVSAYR